jgi:hypothetical protein
LQLVTERLCLLIVRPVETTSNKSDIITMHEPCNKDVVQHRNFSQKLVYVEDNSNTSWYWLYNNLTVLHPVVTEDIHATLIQLRNLEYHDKCLRT